MKKVKISLAALALVLALAGTVLAKESKKTYDVGACSSVEVGGLACQQSNSVHCCIVSSDPLIYKNGPLQ